MLHSAKVRYVVFPYYVRTPICEKSYRPRQCIRVLQLIIIGVARMLYQMEHFGGKRLSRGIAWGRGGDSLLDAGEGFKIFTQKSIKYYKVKPIFSIFDKF